MRMVNNMWLRYKTLLSTSRAVCQRDSQPLGALGDRSALVGAQAEGWCAGVKRRERRPVFVIGLAFFLCGVQNSLGACTAVSE